MNARSVCQVCALTISMAIFAQAASAATTYYVKNGGDNSKDGKSDTNAWATVSRVHDQFNDSGSPIAAGDSVLFKCGDEWAEQLIVSKSGNTQVPGGFITIGAYGSGARPIIGYDDVYSGWTATSGRTNVYQVAASSEVFVVDETTTTGTAAGYFRAYSRKSSVAHVEAQAGSSYWASNVLYVHAFDSTDLSTTITKTLYGNTRGFLVGGSGGDMDLGAIRTNDESYIKIQNVHAVNQGYGIGGMNTDHITIDDCRISGTYTATWFGHSHLATTDSHDITTQNCEVRFNGNGLRHHESNALVAHGNTISDHWTRVSGEDQSMMAFQNCYDVQVYDNDISEGKNGFATWTEAGTTRDDFLIHHNRFHGVINAAVWFLGAGKFGGDLHFYHNVFWLDSGPGAVPQGFRLDAETAASTEPYVIYNNTIRGSQGVRMRNGKPINLVLKNNLFYNCNPHIADDSDAVAASTHTRNYNCYYPVDSTHRIEWAGTSYDDWDDYHDHFGRDIEHNGFPDDPDFLNDPPDKDDVKITASGKADNAGDNTGAPFPPSTADDFYGLAIGGQASVGASEGVSAP